MRISYLSRNDFPANRSDFNKDLVAGLTVAIVALPLALGFAVTTGMSAAAGLTTAIIAGLVAAVFGRTGHDSLTKKERCWSIHPKLERRSSTWLT